MALGLRLLFARYLPVYPPLQGHLRQQLAPQKRPAQLGRHEWLGYVYHKLDGHL